MKKPILPAVLLMSVFMGVSLEAVIPKTWELRSPEEFIKGKFDGVSLSFDGALFLAPREEKVGGPTEEFYLSLFPLSDGSLFLGTGHSGKIYWIGKDGKTELYFQTHEMDVTCLVRDDKGTLYAGTSPNGKIYKITEKGKGEEFFNPAEKYVWDLLFTTSGSLLAAVGESGGIYEINPQGEGKQVLKTEENHILCLRRNPQGDVLAGSGGGGMIYRLTREGRESVLFESPYEEIRSLALDRDGTIYASASGTPVKEKKEESTPPAAKADVEVTVSAIAVAGDATPAAAVSPTSGKEPGALYRIDPDGVAKKLWSSNEELIYSVIWKEDDASVLFGTGPKGRLYSINREEKISLLLQESSEQTFLLYPAGTKTYILGNNPCYLGLLYPEKRFSGEYLSRVLDTKTISKWGRIEWASEAASGATLQLMTRSGNSNEPSPTWSDWSPPYQSGSEQILSPRDRFLQFKALFKTPSGKSSPVLQRTSVHYLQTNIAPVFSKLDLLKPNEVFLKMPDQDDVILGLDTNLSSADAKKEENKSQAAAKKVVRQGFQTVVWDASDENGDALTYSVSIRKEGEAEWRDLRTRSEEAVLAFDTLSFPDGTYFLKVTASDSPSNPQGTELRAEKISRPLVIDNSLPVIKGFSAARSAAGLEVSFQTEDAYSDIEDVSFLIRPDYWRVVFPADGICDSKTENFKFTVKLPSRFDNMITVKVKDSFGNIGVWKQTF